MIEVAPFLYVGDQSAYENQAKYDNEWAIVHACKEPYHRAALGYKGRSPPEGHPEARIARRGTRLILNLVDTADPQYVAKETIDAAHAFIAEARGEGHKVLVHCNQGRSRSPVVAMLYLAANLPDDFEAAEVAFRAVYSNYAPANGMRGFALTHWQIYRSGD